MSAANTTGKLIERDPSFSPISHIKVRTYKNINMSLQYRDRSREIVLTLQGNGTPFWQITKSLDFQFIII